MARNRRAQKPVPARSCLPVYRSGGESSMATAPKPGAAHTSNHWLGGPPGRALGRERGRNGGVALPVNPGRGQGADAGFRGRSGGCGGPGREVGGYGAQDRLAGPWGWLWPGEMHLPGEGLRAGGGASGWNKARLELCGCAPWSVACVYSSGLGAAAAQLCRRIRTQS